MLVAKSRPRRGRLLRSLVKGSLAKAIGDQLTESNRGIAERGEILI